MIRAAGLKPRVSNSTFDVNMPAGRVVEQEPKKGRTVKAGRIVNLTISTGQRQVPVPNMIGRPFNQVEGLLADAGLRLGATFEVQTEEYQTGMIVNQVPSPESNIDSGSSISLFIANNTKFGLVTVPYLVGKTLKEAQDTLMDLKLNLSKIEYQDTDILAPGIVMRQEPAWDQDVSVGSSVTLFVSRTPVTTPEGH